MIMLLVFWFVLFEFFKQYKLRGKHTETEMGYRLPSQACPIYHIHTITISHLVTKQHGRGQSVLGCPSFMLIATVQACSLSLAASLAHAL